MRDRAARPEHDFEQKRRLFAPASGQNSAPHHSQVTTVPSRPRPRLDRLAARPAGDMVAAPLNRAAVAAAARAAASKISRSGSRRPSVLHCFLVGDDRAGHGH